jgi:protein-disulfide isomerase
MMGETGLKPFIGSWDHFQGPANGVWEWIEYGDYQCPQCGGANPIVKRVLRELNGMVKFAFRNFPQIRRHPDALNAAKAAGAAGLQGRFWPMHDLLYENQDYLDFDSLMQYAAEVRIDVNRFARDFRSPKVERKILGDFESGVRSGVIGTPAFFINGSRYQGDGSFGSLMRFMQTEAAQTT